MESKTAMPAQPAGGAWAHEALADLAVLLDAADQISETNPRVGVGRWSAEEKRLYQEAVARFGDNQWSAIARHVGTRNAEQARTHGVRTQRGARGAGGGRGGGGVPMVCRLCAHPRDPPSSPARLSLAPPHSRPHRPPSPRLSLSRALSLPFRSKSSK